MYLELSDVEYDLLTRILDRELSELRVEVRRTDTPTYHDRLKDEERLLEALIEKLAPTA